MVGLHPIAEHAPRMHRLPQSGSSVPCQKQVVVRLGAGSPFLVLFADEQLVSLSEARDMSSIAIGRI